MLLVLRQQAMDLLEITISNSWAFTVPQKIKN
jgi:hypothetical protein